MLPYAGGFVTVSSKQLHLQQRHHAHLAEVLHRVQQLLSRRCS